MTNADNVDDSRADQPPGLERGQVHTLQASPHAPPVPAPYRHQVESLLRLQHGGEAVPPASGIVHLPTGAGKTRVALEFVSRTLKEQPDHRFLWATESRLLIAQTMSAAHSLASKFPGGTRMAWYDGVPSWLEQNDVHLTFLTRRHLTKELAWAHDARSPHPWRVHLEAGRPLTLIYDECHQLGAEGLQKELRKFYEKVLGSRRKGYRWRVIGLSATPVPTRHESHPLLRETIFPLRESLPTTGREWGMHVFFRVENKELIREGVLCPVNMEFDRKGLFDIPHETLSRIVRGAHIRPVGDGASRDDVVEYAAKFNSAVMGHEDIVQFLAEKLARHLQTLRKTVVFVPNIDVANRLVAALAAYPQCRGKVAGVHSRMSEFKHAVPGQELRSPSEVIAEFQRRGSAPCILVNVEMLTEGFDDPSVQTVVLAKLTLSTNRFWQMIGRGTRGPKIPGGTRDCLVVDPIKLVRLYDYFSGYQPSVGGRAGGAIEDEPEETSAGALDPSVPAVSFPPLPSSVEYSVSSELRQTHAAVVHAIESFLQGARLGEEDAIAIARGVQISCEDRGVVVVAGPAATTGPVLLQETVVRMSARMQCDLFWVDRQLPSETTDEVLRFWIRKLAAIEKLGLRTEDDYSRAEMDGRVARELAIAVATSASPGPEAPPSSPWTAPTRDVARLCMAVARADDQVPTAEVDVVVRVMGRLTGALDSEELRGKVSSLSASEAECAESIAELGATWEQPQRKALLRGLVEVAAADGSIDRREIDLVVRIAQGFGISGEYVEALVDVQGC